MKSTQELPEHLSGMSLVGHICALFGTFNYGLIRLAIQIEYQYILIFQCHAFAKEMIKRQK